MISTVLMLGLRTYVRSKKILQEILKMQLISLFCWYEEAKYFIGHSYRCPIFMSEHI